MQVSSDSIKEILKIKKTFPQLLNKKVEEIHKSINNLGKPKPYINITTKGPLWKQIIISMSNNNISVFMKLSDEHMANINCAFKDVKSDNFVHTDYWGLIVNSNKIASVSDFLVVKSYIQNLNTMNANNVQDTRLPQSKSYLKILSILYLIESTNILINTNIMETIIKTTHIFNNIASKLRVIKVSPKSDMAIVWIDIWDIQSNNSAKHSLTDSLM